jgi:hypothetical protein
MFSALTAFSGCSGQPAPTDAEDPVDPNGTGGSGGIASSVATAGGPVALASGGGAVSGTGGAPIASSGGMTNAGGAGGASAGGLVPVDPSCGLPNAAFCDAFTKASPGGRAGDLDDARWSFSRLGFGCAYAFAFPQTPINLCGNWQTVAPGGPDSEFCKNENNDPRWVEGFHDNTDFQYISVRPRQPFDFDGRTGTLQWEADARTSGGHGWWLETWITSDPTPGPNFHAPDQIVSSKEAIGVMLDVNCGVPPPTGSTSGSGKVGVSDILLVHDYKWTEMYNPFGPGNNNSRCVTTAQGSLNKFQFKISKSRIEVWASDAGSTELQRIAEADIDLGFTRGYAHLSHVHYNAHKAEVTSFQSYQWARVAFDGPQLSTPRAYEIPDPLTKVPQASTCGPEAVYRIAYGVTNKVVYDLSSGPSSPRMLKFPGVDPKGGTSAHLNFNTTDVSPGDTLSFRLNGGQWHDYVVPAIGGFLARESFSLPVPVGDLVAGDNIVEFGTTSKPATMPPGSMNIANIDLEIEVP